MDVEVYQGGWFWVFNGRLWESVRGKRNRVYNQIEIRVILFISLASNKESPCSFLADFIKRNIQLINGWILWHDNKLLNNINTGIFNLIIR